MKRKILLLIVLAGFLWACKRGPHGGCGTCPTFDSKSYKKKLKSNK